MAYHFSSTDSSNANLPSVSGTSELVHASNGALLHGVSLVDGYNGSSAGLDCQHRLLHEVLDGRSDSLVDSIARGFQNMQERMKLLTSKFWPHTFCGKNVSGCSATVVVSKGTQIGVATAGDNMVYVFASRGNSLKELRLMNHHHLSNPFEKRKLQDRINDLPQVNNGIQINIERLPLHQDVITISVQHEDGSSYQQPLTCLTRGLGNLWGDFGPSGQVCIANPEIILFPLAKLQNCFIVVVTRNVYELLTEDRICMLMNESFKMNPAHRLGYAAMAKDTDTDYGPMSVLVIDVNQFVFPEYNVPTFKEDTTGFIFRFSNDVRDNVYDLWQIPGLRYDFKRYLSHEEWQSLLYYCGQATKENRGRNEDAANHGSPANFEFGPESFGAPTLVKSENIKHEDHSDTLKLNFVVCEPTLQSNMREFAKLICPSKWIACTSVQNCEQVVPVPKALAEYESCNVILNFTRKDSASTNIQTDQNLAIKTEVSSNSPHNDAGTSNTSNQRAICTNEKEGACTSRRHMRDTRYKSVKETLRRKAFLIYKPTDVASDKNLQTIRCRKRENPEQIPRDNEKNEALPEIKVEHPDSVERNHKRISNKPPPRNQRVFRIRVKPPVINRRYTLVNAEYKIRDNIDCDLSFITSNFIEEALQLNPLQKFESVIEGKFECGSETNFEGDNSVKMESDHHEHLQNKMEDKFENVSVEELDAGKDETLQSVIECKLEDVGEKQFESQNEHTLDNPVEDNCVNSCEVTFDRGKNEGFVETSEDKIKSTDKERLQCHTEEIFEGSFKYKNIKFGRGNDKQFLKSVDENITSANKGKNKGQVEDTVKYASESELQSTDDDVFENGSDETIGRNDTNKWESDNGEAFADKIDDIGESATEDTSTFSIEEKENIGQDDEMGLNNTFEKLGTNAEPPDAGIIYLTL